MKVRLLTPVAALDAAAGDIVDVNPFLASEWIKRGHAEKVLPDVAEIKGKDSKGAEVATAVPEVETRSAPEAEAEAEAEAEPEPEPEPEPEDDEKPAPPDKPKTPRPARVKADEKQEDE